MEEETKRQKGGQKGNQNALKHGFYSKAFNEAEKFDFKDASGVEGLDEELALLRLEIKKAISGGDERNLLLLVKAVGALEKIVRTRYQISTAQRQGWKDTISTIVKEVLIPMGVNIGSSVVTRKMTG